MNKNNLSHEKEFIDIQNNLSAQIVLQNKFSMDQIKTIAGVDLAYWEKNGKDYAVCSIVLIEYSTKNILEKKYCLDEIKVPYIAGYLSFRELPLILETCKLLENKPSIFMFDGNGYLHYRHMGIATHASFYLNKPTIGIAKSYLKIDNVEFEMPQNEDKAYSNIIINGEVYGRALRTHKNIKPIFVSCGNWIDIDTVTDITLNLVDSESRQPMPTRFADIETKKLRAILRGNS